MRKRILGLIFVVLSLIGIGYVSFSGPVIRPKYTRLTKLELTEGVLDMYVPKSIANYSPNFPRASFYYLPITSTAGVYTIDVTSIPQGSSQLQNGFSVRLGINDGSLNPDGTIAPTDEWKVHAGTISGGGYLDGQFDPNIFDHGSGLGSPEYPWGGLTLLGQHNSNWSSGANDNHSGPIQWRAGINPLGSTPAAVQYSIFSRKTGRLMFMNGYSNRSLTGNTVNVPNTTGIEFDGGDPDKDQDGTTERWVLGRYIQVVSKSISTISSDASFIDSTGAIGSNLLTLGPTSDSPASGSTSGMIRVGQNYRISAMGIYTTDASAGNATWKIKLGSTTLATTSAIALPNSQTNRMWKILGDFTVRAIGDTGTIIGQGELKFFTATSTATFAEMPMSATSTIDFADPARQTLAWDVTVNMDNSGNTITSTNISVEVM